MTVVRHASVFFFLMTCLSSASFGQTTSKQSGFDRHEYFIDCSSPFSGSGKSSASPWNSLDSLQSKVFFPGEVIKLRRGTECHGSLWPKGSGSSDHPLRLTAYGEGQRPKVTAGASFEEALRLSDQQYWDIDSLNLSGGTTYGISISGTKDILHHIHLSNIAVHDVFGGTMKNKDNGLVVFSSASVDQHFDDVLVDGVTAWNTNQWVGIMVGGGNLGYPPENIWNTNVVIRNSSVHDVQGDGIVLFRVHGGRIDSSVAWDTGMQITQTIGTPNAIWAWMCDDCTVEGNEAYLTDSPGVDGGAFDIDYGNTKNSVVGNYGHDTQGYCVAVFGAGFVTRQSTVRKNLCINNGRSPRMANYQGAFFLLSWNGGSIDGLTVENNIIYWDPYENAPALVNGANIQAGTAVFRNNKIYSTSRRLVQTNTALSFAQNHYDYFGAGAPEWGYGTQKLSSLQEVQGEVHQEFGSSLAQYPLNLWPTVYREQADGAQKQRARRQSMMNRGLSLRCDLPASLSEQGLLSDATLRQAVVLKSLSQQYRAQGLLVSLNLTSPDGDLFKSESFRNAISDLDLNGIVLSETVGNARERTLLVRPDGTIAGHWTGFVGPDVLGLVARRWMGEPIYSQMKAKTNE
jgi:hypothetical protein